METQSVIIKGNTEQKMANKPDALYGQKDLDTKPSHSHSHIFAC